METCSNFLDQLQHSANLSDEVITLEGLLTDLNPAEKSQNQSNDLEEEWLSMAAENLGDDDEDIVNPFPKVTPNQQFTQQDDLNQFICYVFMRRFGWSEGINGESVQEARSLASPLQRGKLAMEKEAQHKAKLNELLDELIRW